MNENSVSQKLLRGSRNIDQMKIDIVELANMLVGLILKAALDIEISEPVTEIDIQIPFGSRTWKAKTRIYKDRFHEDRQVTASITCLMGGKNRFTGFPEEIVFSDNFKDGRVPGLSKDAVSEIHDNLDLLVEGVREHFPSISKHWEPIIKAA